MTLQEAAVLAEVLELIGGEEAALAQNGVQGRSSMTFAQNKAIAILHLGVLRINVHFLKVQCDQRFHDGERSTGMAAAGSRRHVDDVAAHLRARGTNRSFHCLSSLSIRWVYAVFYGINPDTVCQGCSYNWVT